jgi:hypothetical protein
MFNYSRHSDTRKRRRTGHVSRCAEAITFGTTEEEALETALSFYVNARNHSDLQQLDLPRWRGLSWLFTGK